MQGEGGFGGRLWDVGEVVSDLSKEQDKCWTDFIKEGPTLTICVTRLTKISKHLKKRTGRNVDQGFVTVPFPPGILSTMVIVHGGAWSIPENLSEASVDGVKRAVRAGHAVLLSGGSAVQAVETAIAVLEDDPAFDAGTGSVLTSAGEVEMDAVIMDGVDLNAGGVACVQNILNPIKLARLVMEKTDHVLLVGKGANQFADEMGISTVSSDRLVTEAARKEWETFQKFKPAVATLFKDRTSQPIQPSGCDTVGAVALDSQGNMAFGTSTGGITAKRPGRVGDSPLVGCGGYCDNAVGGVSTTGHGESIIKVCLAKHITDMMKQGLSPQKAVETSLEFMTSRVQGSGGGIAISRDGEIGWAFSTERMVWAWAKQGQLHYGINHGDDFVENMTCHEDGSVS